MSNVTNHNHGHGTFNNVFGSQTNRIDLARAIVFFYQNGTISQTSFPTVNMASSKRYSGVVRDIYDVYLLLEGFMIQPFSPGYLLVPIQTQMQEFARVIAYVARALDIIDEIPGDLKLLRHFRKLEELIQGYSYRLHKMHEDINAYKIQLGSSQPPGFLRDLSLYIFSRYRWGFLADAMKHFLEENREMLEHFLRFLVSRSWRKIIPEEYSQEFERLISEAGLQADPSIHHVKMLTILVRDHLGRILPIPLEFCTSWMDFEIVIQHCCQGVEGREFVERNDWEVVRAKDNMVVDRLDTSRSITSVLQPGLEFDISIVIRAFISSMFLCPRCNRNNTGKISYNGWIDCEQCGNYFRVVHIAPGLPQNQTVINAQAAEGRNQYDLASGLIASLLEWVKEILRYLFKYIQRLLLQLGARHDATSSRHVSEEEAGETHGVPLVGMDSPDPPEGDMEYPNPTPLHQAANLNFKRVSVRVQRLSSQPVINQIPPPSADTAAESGMSGRREWDTTRNMSPTEGETGRSLPQESGNDLVMNTPTEVNEVVHESSKGQQQHTDMIDDLVQSAVEETESNDVSEEAIDDRFITNQDTVVSSPFPVAESSLHVDMASDSQQQQNTTVQTTENAYSQPTAEPKRRKSRWSFLQSSLLSTPKQENGADPFIIVVLGSRGSGKSTFINSAIGERRLPVGESREPREPLTETVQVLAHVRKEETFVFIDTPDISFFPSPELIVDSINQLSSRSVRSRVRSLFSNLYRSRGRADALIYMQNVNKLRVQNDLLSYEKTFRDLCGDDWARKTMFVTTMWESSLNQPRMEREKALAKSFWAKAGLKMDRYSGGAEDAWRIIDRIIADHKAPV